MDSLSFSLLNLTIGAVLYMHGFNNGGTILNNRIFGDCFRNDFMV